jgi:hypothetical protein
LGWEVLRQFRQITAQCRGDFAQDGKSEIALASLNTTYVTTVNIALVGKVLLAKTQSRARRPNTAPKLLQLW